MTAESPPEYIDAQGDEPMKFVINNAGGVEGAVITFTVTSISANQFTLTPSVNDIARDSPPALLSLRIWRNRLLTVPPSGMN